MWVSAFSENSVHGWIKNLTRDNKAARVKPVGCGIKNGEIKDLELGKNYAKARIMKRIDEIKSLVTQHADWFPLNVSAQIKMNVT